MKECDKHSYLLILAIILRKQYIQDLKSLEEVQVNLLRQIMLHCVQEVSQNDMPCLHPFIKKWSSVSVELFELTIPLFKEVYEYVHKVSMKLFVKV